MANFKNTIEVRCEDIILLEAVEKKVIELGYEIVSSNNGWKSIYLLTGGIYQFGAPNALFNAIVLNIPSQWNEFVRLASEKEEKFKVGDWVVCKEYPKEYIGVIHKIEDGKIYYKGKDDKSNVRLATPQEIEAYLIAEAEKKGFVKGAKVIRYKKEFKDTFYNTVEKKFFDTSGLTDTRIIEELRILNSKVFAKVSKTTDYILVDIEALRLLSSCPQIKVGSYEVEFFEDHIMVGCTKVDLNQIKAIHDHYNKKLCGL